MKLSESKKNVFWSIEKNKTTFDIKKQLSNW
jgi:hypothetical protein